MGGKEIAGWLIGALYGEAVATVVCKTDPGLSREDCLCHMDLI